MGTGPTVFDGVPGRGPNPSAGPLGIVGPAALIGEGAVDKDIGPPEVRVIGGSKNAEIPGEHAVHRGTRVRSVVGTDITGEHGL